MDQHESFRQEARAMRQQLPPGFHILAGWNPETSTPLFMAKDDFDWYGPRRDTIQEILPDAQARFEERPALYRARELIEKTLCVRVMELGVAFLVEPRDDDGVEIEDSGALLVDGESAALLRRSMLNGLRDEQVLIARQLRLMDLSDADLRTAFDDAVQKHRRKAVLEEEGLVGPLIDLVRTSDA